MDDELVKVNTALVSVADKTGVVDFARELAGLGITLMATGGTYTAIKESGVQVRSLQDDLNLPQALSGRVKTLHSPLFGAILAKRTPEHLAELRAMKVDPIDMVVVNFYPFERVASDPSSDDETIIENIDIGGPSMVRASTKNFRYVTVVASPRHYAPVLAELKANGGKTSLHLRRRLAVDAISITGAYDVAIYNGLWKRFEGVGVLPSRFLLSATKFQDAKYGENPDQKATIYSIDGSKNMTNWQQLAGDTLSFNNYLDIGSAHAILEGFDDTPAAATVKHGNISGFAFAPTVSEAYELAHSCDPEADFGGTVILNREVDRETAMLIGKNEGVKDSSVYTEIVIAPGYQSEVVKTLESKQKKKMRIIKTTGRSTYPYDIKVIEGAVLLQEAVDYRKKLDPAKLTVPTKTKPEVATLAKLLAAWEVVRRVPSNGIVVADGRYEDAALTHFWTLGVASFRKRNGAVRVALMNAGERAQGSVCASDGFFPFRDNIEMLGAAGVKAVIQPGGSVSDQDIVTVADRYGMCMVMTHTRAFKH
ncbi:MAG: bifunctional phosphoribosylaminoimidazolecarboxamide formyltransferase/IMP cyclohydrolase [Nitrososphaerota archaeon]|nr:bifunctional phosphoribosylaminoimidazolecarboxamide formyltransferase/IMP cyclohydrolase [Nitrososphaerota archaeon]